MTTRPLTDREIELAASHAAASTRLTGMHEQARRALLVQHQAETAALRKELGIPDDEPMPGDPEKPDQGGNIITDVLPFILPMLARTLFGGGRAAGFEQNPDPNPFAGPVTPPTVAPPGVPVVIPPPTVPGVGPWEGTFPAPSSTMSSVVELPISGGTIPPMSAAPPTTRAPMPGTGTHPGCSVAAPCAKHGGAAAAIPDSIPIPPAPAEPAHYDGRPLTDKMVSCTIYKPCRECVDRSRRPIATTLSGGNI